MPTFLIGRAVYHASNGASEERTYVDNIPHGSATLYLTSGDTEERTYENGQLHGIATFVSNNGDRYICSISLDTESLFV